MKLFLSYLFVITITLTHAQQPTVGVTLYNNTTSNGYVLFAPISSTTTYLVDKCGKVVHQWSSIYRPGQSVYLLPNGNLLRTGAPTNTTFNSGGQGGIIELFDWDGNLLWSYLISDSSQCQHHDVKPLPNGNVLAIVWDRKTAAEATAAGRNQVGTELWSEKIIEIQPTGPTTGTIVWQWNLWDHLVQEFDNTKANYADVFTHAELMHLNFNGGPPTQADWVHLNAIDYNPVLNQIMLSSHNFSEVWVIDHTTTTQQAATHSGGSGGKGGDFLFRWGNPRAYQHGTISDQQLFGQHNAQWINDSLPNGGKILVFNNGLNRPAGDYSSIDILDVNTAYPTNGSGVFLPDTAFWSYTAPTPTDFYGSNISGVQQLTNGGFMVCNGPNGVFFELDENETTNWQYVSPVSNSGIVNQGSAAQNNQVFRCTFYPTTYMGFNGHALTPSAEIEGNPTNPPLCQTTALATTTALAKTAVLFPNPAAENAMLNLTGFTNINLSAMLVNLMGQQVWQQQITSSTQNISLAKLPAGVYFLCLQGINYKNSLRLIKY